MDMAPHHFDFSYSLALELTPLRVEQDRDDFARQNQLQSYSDLSLQRG